jgi:hypothetical protein
LVSYHCIHLDQLWYDVRGPPWGGSVFPVWVRVAVKFTLVYLWVKIHFFYFRLIYMCALCLCNAGQLGQYINKLEGSVA